MPTEAQSVDEDVALLNPDPTSDPQKKTTATKREEIDMMHIEYPCILFRIPNKLFTVLYLYIYIYTYDLIPVINVGDHVPINGFLGDKDKTPPVPKTKGLALQKPWEKIHFEK